MLVFIINCQKPKYGREFYLSFGLFGYIFLMWLSLSCRVNGWNIELQSAVIKLKTYKFLLFSTLHNLFTPRGVYVYVFTAPSVL